MINKIRYKIKQLNINWRNFFKKPNKEAIWIFGFQKSGTSAIARLFAIYVGKSSTIDTKYLWEPYKTKMLKKGIKYHVNRYSLDFSKDIIKEPAATFFIPVIEEYFKMKKYIFIIRNPYDNIRSILNRLNVAGNLDFIDISTIDYRWRDKFKNKGSNYIKDLAELWLEANSQENYMTSNKCVLVRYEDFVDDKISFIENLADKFELEKVNDISSWMNKPFQPTGNPNIDLLKFFGEKNMKIITDICGKRMEELGYNNKCNKK